MRLRLAILAALALALVAAPVARADHGPAYSDPTLDRYMQIAAQYWNAPVPTCTDDDGHVIYPHAVLANDPDPSVAAWAEVGGCRMWLDTDFWPARPSEQYCNLIAHEWGHLLGHQHSSDPNDLMWGQWTNNVVPACREFAVSRPAPAPAAPGPSPTGGQGRLVRLRRAQHACVARWRRKARGRSHRTRWYRRHLRKAKRACAARHARASAAAVPRRWHGHPVEPGPAFSAPLGLGPLTVLR